MRGLLASSREFAGAFARTFAGALADAVAPPLCAMCRGPPGPLPWLCDPCARTLRLLRPPLCLRCGASRPLTAPTCADCPPWPPLLVAARAGAAHEGTARELIHALKYEGSLAAARPLAEFATAAARSLPLARGVVVVPVPLWAPRRRARGFNQAEEISRTVARGLGRPHRPRWLRRVRGGTESAHRSVRGRWRAARGAFRARESVRGRTLLLVDDVLTTGATLDACARALRRRGAAEVWAVTATRAL